MIVSAKMRGKIAAYLKECNYSIDSAYSKIMGELGLFGNAYFGYHSSKYERRKMREIWRAILAQSLELNPNLREWQKVQIRSFLKINQ